MSSEVCPFCGKTYKRLKSHLPHCKAAPGSKTPPNKHGTTTNQTNASMSKEKEKGKKSQTEKVSSSSKKNKTTTSSPSPSKLKKQSLRALIEAAKMAPEDFLSDSRTTGNTDTKSISGKSTDTQPKDPFKETEETPQTVSRPNEGPRFWEDSHMTSKITLQDVRASLGRKTRSRPSILSQIQAAGVSVPPHPQNQSLSEEQTSEKKVSDPKQLREPASPPQLRPLTPAAPLLPASRDVSLKVTESLHFPLTPHSEHGTKTQNTEGALTHRRFGQVRLKELPDWLSCKAPTHPREVIEIMQKGWQWYYRKYIDVKKGGVAGVGMLLAGYCVLSYIWNYPHIKRDRWRKYH